MSKGAPWKAPRDEDCLDMDGLLLLLGVAVLDGLLVVFFAMVVASVALALVSSVMVGESVALHIVDCILIEFQF